MYGNVYHLAGTQGAVIVQTVHCPSITPAVLLQRTLRIWLLRSLTEPFKARWIPHSPSCESASGSFLSTPVPQSPSVQASSSPGINTCTPKKTYAPGLIPPFILQGHLLFSPLPSKAPTTLRFENKYGLQDPQQWLASQPGMVPKEIQAFSDRLLSSSHSPPRTPSASHVQQVPLSPFLQPPAPS